MSSSSESGAVDTPEESDWFFDGGTTEQEQTTARYGSELNVTGDNTYISEQMRT